MVGLRSYNIYPGIIQALFIVGNFAPKNGTSAGFYGCKILIDHICEITLNAHSNINMSSEEKE